MPLDGDVFYNVFILGLSGVFAALVLVIALAWIEFAFREWRAGAAARRVQTVDVSAELRELERLSLGSDWP